LFKVGILSCVPDRLLPVMALFMALPTGFIPSSCPLVLVCVQHLVVQDVMLTGTLFTGPQHEGIRYPVDRPEYTGQGSTGVFYSLLEKLIFFFCSVGFGAGTLSLSHSSS
jgi:hypothetical protein